VIEIVNNTIPKEKREKIMQLSNKGYSIHRIARLTETSRPTVRKYQNYRESNERS
jgi:response regulator of citrate/malate metabolism